jgi:hypothetical protein
MVATAIPVLTSWWGGRRLVRLDPVPDGYFQAPTLAPFAICCVVVGALSIFRLA